MKRFLVFLGFLLCAFVAIRFAPQADAQFTPPALPRTYTDIATPSQNPLAGSTTVYTKAGTVCSLDPSGNEKCTGSGGAATFAAPYVTSGANVFGPNWLLTQPPLTGWTAIGSATIDTASGFLYLTKANTSAVAIQGAIHAVPASTPFSITLAIQYDYAYAIQGQSPCIVCGFEFGLSDGTKYVTRGGGELGNSGFQWQSCHWTNATTQASCPDNPTAPSLAVRITRQPLWIRVSDDGTTNITFYYSIDGGTHWVQDYQEGRNSFLASVADVFVGMITDGGNVQVALIDYSTNSIP